jgi:TctA family transporter
MARRGRAGIALATAALASFFAGTVATFLIAAFAPPLAEVAFKFGPAEYFSLMVLGLIAAVVLAHGSIIKALGMVVLGLLLGMIGTDVNSGTARFTLGIPELTDGIEFAVIAMGMFGFAEIIYNLKQTESRELLQKKVTNYMPNKEDWRRGGKAAVRGTALGSFLGILPGGGSILASFSAYAMEKKISKRPDEFGKGAIEGVAGPEAANNAGAQTSFIPMLTLGIPTTPVMALMIAAMMIHNIQPGPQVMTSNPTLFWGLIVSMWAGNLFLVILNLPLIGLWIKLLQVPYRFLYPAILLFCCIGAYSLNNNVWDVLMTIPFAIMGYYFKKWHCEPAPLLMGFILGELMEEYLRRALTISRGDWGVFIDRPLSATLLGIAVLLLLIVALPFIRKKRDQAFAGEED